MTEKAHRRQTRFFTGEAPPDPNESTGWFYRAREGTFGPFPTQEEARLHLRQNLGSSEPTRPAGLLQRLMDALRGRLDLEPEIRRGRAGGKGEAGSLSDADPRETDLFDRPARLMQPMAADNLRRLPNNRTVDVEVADEEQGLSVYLASHRFVLRVTPAHLQLEDESGRVHLLYEGTSSVGRHTENDLVVDRGYTEVSRFHLLIDWDGGPRVNLTDTSTLGTFVDYRALV